MVALEAFGATVDGLVSFRTGELLGSDGGEGPAEFVYGTTKPDATNTGLSAALSGTLTGGTWFIDAGGTAEAPLVFANQRIERRLVIRAPYVSFVNCEFVGPPVKPTNNHILVDHNHVNCVGVRFERCRARPQAILDANGRAWDRCFQGHDATWDRCDVSGAVDAFAWLNSGGPLRNRLRGSYVHDLCWQAGAAAAGQSDGTTHNDIIQFHAGVNDFEVYGNTLLAKIDASIGGDYEAVDWTGAAWSTPVVAGYPWFGLEPEGKAGIYGPTATLMFSPASGGSIIGTVDNNWINGGAVGLNMAGYTGTHAGFSVRNNRWGRDFSRGLSGGGTPNDDWTIIKQSGFHFGALSGNTYEDDGTPWDRGTSAGTWP